MTKKIQNWKNHMFCTDEKHHLCHCALMAYTWFMETRTNGKGDVSSTRVTTQFCSEFFICQLSKWILYFCLSVYVSWWKYFVHIYEVIKFNKSQMSFHFFYSPNKEKKRGKKTETELTARVLKKWSKTHKRLKRTLFNLTKRDKMWEFFRKSYFSKLRIT